MSNETEDRSPKFNRAVLARIAAVLAFICLGTFAVVQSVLTDRTTKDEVALNQEGSEDISLQKPELSGDVETTPPADGDAAPPASKNGTAAPPSIAEQKSINTLSPAQTIANPLAARSKPSGKSGEIVVDPSLDRPRTNPPERFAQAGAPGQFPIVPSDSSADEPKVNSAKPNRNAGQQSKTENLLGNNPLSGLKKLDDSLAATADKFQANVRTQVENGKNKVKDSAIAAQQQMKSASNSALDAISFESKSFGGGGFGKPEEAPNSSRNALPPRQANNDRAPATIGKSVKAGTSFPPLRGGQDTLAQSAPQGKSNVPRDGFAGGGFQPSADTAKTNPNPLAVRPQDQNPSFGSNPATPRGDLGAKSSAAPPSSFVPLANNARPSADTASPPAATNPSLDRPNNPSAPSSSINGLSSSRPTPMSSNQFGPINPSVQETPRTPIRSPSSLATNRRGTQSENASVPPSRFGEGSRQVPAKQAATPMRQGEPGGRITEPNGFGSTPPPTLPSSRPTPPHVRQPGGGVLTQAIPGDQQLEGAQTPSLTIQKLAPREIQVNQAAEFVIDVRNVGRVIANQVVVVDEVPNGCEFVSSVPPAHRSPDGKLRWQLDSLAPDQQKQIKLTIRPIQPGEIGSVAQVTFSSQASVRTRVTKPVLSVTHSAPRRVLIGNNVTLDILVENRGDGPAKNVLLQEDVPQQLLFQNGFRELEYEIGNLAPGQSRNVRLTLQAAKVGAFKNIVQASAAGGLQTRHSVDMEVIAPKLVARSSGPNRRFIKREATHTFDVENKGTANATNVELTARLPRGLKFVKANNRGEYDPNAHAVYWSLAELGPNLPASVELTTLPIDSGNQKITFDVGADLGQQASAEKDLLVEHLIDVFFDIDDRVDPIEINAPTSYEVRLVNQGTIEANNIQLVLDFPQGMRPESVDGNLPNEIRGQSIVFAPITSLRPGDELKFNVTARGLAPGDHKVVLRMQTDGRATSVSKQETTRVYNDR